MGLKIEFRMYWKEKNYIYKDILFMDFWATQAKQTKKRFQKDHNNQSFKEFVVL